MDSVADVWNTALSLVGSDAEVQNADTDLSTPAKVCRRHWPTVRDEVLRDFGWPKLTTTEDLALVEADPNDGIEWAYSYAYPSNCMRLRRILNGESAIDVETNVTRYKLGRAPDGSVLIFCDLEDAQVEYVYAEQQVARYDADVASAMAHLLASRIAVKFGEGALPLGDRALKIYAWRLAEARANALNEQNPKQDDGSSFERAR